MDTPKKRLIIGPGNDTLTISLNRALELAEKFSAEVHLLNLRPAHIKSVEETSPQDTKTFFMILAVNVWSFYPVYSGKKLKNQIISTRTKYMIVGDAIRLMLLKPVATF